MDIKEEGLSNGHTNPMSECRACIGQGFARHQLPEPPVELNTFRGAVVAWAQAKGFYDTCLNSYDQTDLEYQHNSLVDVIAAAPLYEGEFVLARLRRGKVDGSTFGDGGRSCSCLLGTMATAANAVEKKGYEDGASLGYELSEMYGIEHFYAQDLFGPIDVGDKPSNCLSAALADQYITELLMSNRATLGREERAATRKLVRAFSRGR
jgi:hypothetical protein